MGLQLREIQLRTLVPLLISSVILGQLLDLSETLGVCKMRMNNHGSLGGCSED